jgi:hypothetical protein
MTPEKWEKIVGNIEDNFEVKDRGEEHIDDEGGIDLKYIEFDGPMGHMRLEFVVKPAVLDKKTTYSRRIGSETKVDYVYSDTEKAHILNVYKWDDAQDDWIEVDGKMFE